MGGVQIAIPEGLPGEWAEVQSGQIGVLGGGHCTDHDSGRVGVWRVSRRWQSGGVVGIEGIKGCSVHTDMKMGIRI